MASKAKQQDVTVKCPDCGGGVRPAARYTDPDTVCETCHGEGVVAKNEKPKTEEAAG